ncbi:MAG TPA: hypothetical protein VHG28_12610, partial [Longimicrobiaceae bacterium]|nr:hypothetical protein [Longimicrobiaceae bacterium]
MPRSLLLRLLPVLLVLLALLPAAPPALLASSRTPDSPPAVRARPPLQNPTAWWAEPHPSADPGQTRSLPFRATNHSDTPRTLCFTARVDSSTIWAAGPTAPACQPFGAGEERELSVTYTVRAGAMAGEQGRVSIGVHDQEDPTYRNTPPWVTVTVNPYLASPTVTAP